MIKKKAKKTAAKKTAKRKSATRTKKETNPAAVRKEVSKMVESEARKMARAVIGEGIKGQLATVKYLFEVASIFPPDSDPNQGSANEDCLAQTLLRRLDLPDEPIRRDDDDVPVRAAVPVKEKPAHEDESDVKSSGPQSNEPEHERVDQGKESPVLV
jgi:hypothetical protein